MKTRWKILGLVLAVWIILTLLCYFFDWPWPVFCCYFHNWVNLNLNVNQSWICNETYTPPPDTTIYCNDALHPECQLGECPWGQECVEYVHIATGQEGCKCVPFGPDEDDPGQLGCSDTDGYADIFTYGECSDGTGTYEDECVNQQLYVSELWCENGYCMGASYECPYPSVCYRGECIDCNVVCTDYGRPWGGYYSGGISCDDFEAYISAYQCCCYPSTG